MTDRQQLSLRPALESDNDWIFEIRRATLREYVEQTWGPWDDDWQRRKYLESPNLECTRVVEIDGRPVGAMTVRWQPDAVRLDRIHITPDMQNQGLGTRLVSDLQNQARAHGLPVKLHVMRVNPARRLYERLGFSVADETDTHFLMEWPSGSR